MKKILLAIMTSVALSSSAFAAEPVITPTPSSSVSVQTPKVIKVKHAQHKVEKKALVPQKAQANHKHHKHHHHHKKVSKK